MAGSINSALGIVGPNTSNSQYTAMGLFLDPFYLGVRNQHKYQFGPSLRDLRVQGVEYGNPIAWASGGPRLAGQIWWASTKRQISHTSESVTGGGGKGGGGRAFVTTTTVTYTYDVDLLLGICDNEIEGIEKIWKNGALIWDESTTETAEWDRITIYTGDTAQLPDPTYEAAKGIGSTPAYRGRAYVFLQNVHLGQSGSIANYTFKIKSGFVDTPADTKLLKIGERDAVQVIDYNITPQVAQEYNNRLYALNIYNASTMALVAERDLVPYTTTQWKHGLDGVFSYSDLTGGNTPYNNGALATIDPDTGVHSDLYTVSGFGLGGCCAPYGLSSYLFTTVYDAGGPGHVHYLRRIASGGAGAVVDCALPVNYYPSLLAYKLTGSALTIWVSNGNNAANIYAVDGTTMVASYNFSFTNPHATSPSVMRYHEATDTLVFADYWGYQVHDPITRTNAVRVEFATQLQWFFDDLRYGFWALNTGNRLYFHDIVTGTTTEETTFNTAALASYPTHNIKWAGYALSNGLLFLIGDDGALSGTIYEEFLYVPDDVVLGGNSIRSVVSAICARTGLQSNQYDVSGLQGVTKPVRGFMMSQTESGRAALDLLAAAFYFEATVSDKIYFRSRGGAPVMTIPYEDLGASTDNTPAETLPIKIASDIEMPAQYAITYPNVDASYQLDTLYSDRLTSVVSGTVRSMQIAIGMTSAEAKGLVDTMLLDQYVALTQTRFSVLGDYSELEPCDVVLVENKNGQTFRLRIVKRMDSFPLLQFEAVLDDASVLIEQGIVTADYDSGTSVATPVNTDMLLLDIPILRDDDNDMGFYVATKGDGTPYQGSTVYKSSNDADYVTVVSVAESATFGACQTVLGDWAGPRVFDEVSTVTVDVGAGALSNTTRDIVLNDQSVNAFLIGDEVVQAVNAALVTTGIYILSGLLRGCRGTEWAMTGHAASERAVWLRTLGMRRIVPTNAELGIDKYYRGVTVGRSYTTAGTQTFADTAVGLKPFSPFALRAARDGSSNITLTWQRRTRMAVRMVGALGISVPLGEESELYEIDIYALGSPTAVVRTLTATTASVDYSAADQTTDFGAPQSSVAVSVRQMSAVVGRGYQNEATV
jgi:hypothetical protein